MTETDQKLLSEQLQLLHELSYSDLDIPIYHAPGAYNTKNLLDPDSKTDIRILNTIAAALTTGNPGDVFAAAFDKHQQVQLVLAKNTPPSDDDISAANELVSLLGNPSIANPVDLFPFLIKRCHQNMNRRINRLHLSIQDEEVRNDFAVALEYYTPKEDIKVEFPNALWIKKFYQGTPPEFINVWNDLVEEITMLSSEGISADNIIESRTTYLKLALGADTLRRSHFLNSFLDDHDPYYERKDRVEKLKRCVSEVMQYIHGIGQLIQSAKRILPIHHYWVTDTFSGTGEGVFDLCDNPYDAIWRGLEPHSSPPTIGKLDQDFPSLLSNWRNHQTIHACLHAELRIILHLGPSLFQEFGRVHPIGVSEQSCLCCALWIEYHNREFRPIWMTSGCHGKPDANWALPGAACSYALVDVGGRSLVDKAVLDAISERLTDTLDRLYPDVRRNSDSGEDEDDEWTRYMM